MAESVRFPSDEVTARAAASLDPASPFGIYIHVPFCVTRCGYCDFNTYTPGDLGSTSSPRSYLDSLELELERAAAVLEGRAGARRADTVFIGGGTPSLLGAEGLARILRAVRRTLGIAPDAEITTESNPESTSPEFFEGLVDAGYTRVSLGMQSTAEHVLKILERRHTPGRPLAAATEALAAGLQHVNLDVIYGTPTETDDDVRATVEAAVATGVDHLSAYSLIVEKGTAMHRKVFHGQLPAPEEDTLARRYEIIDSLLRDAGMEWYEVSNWARPGGECRHNEIYWVDGDWWGAGPGAHSHLGDYRFYNAKHPATYSRMLAQGGLAFSGGERLYPADRHTEKVMLGMRLKAGIPLSWIAATAHDVVEGYVSRGLLEIVGDRDKQIGLRGNRGEPRLRVTAPGRLLADGMVTDILLAEEAAADACTPTGR